MSLIELHCTYMYTIGQNFGLIYNILGTAKRYEDIRNPGKRNIYKIIDLFGLCMYIYSHK